MEKGKETVIVGGYLGLIQVGGAAWDYIQYPLGLYLMGYDVYYIEDTRMFPVFGNSWNDSLPTIRRLEKLMKVFGLQDRWAYRDEVTGKIYGLTERKYKDLFKNADVFINISCANVVRDECLDIPVRILVDSDPMFSQIQMVSDQSFTSSKSHLSALADKHTHHFTFGENINGDNCLIPKTKYDWNITRQPICINYWKHLDLIDSTAPFTTLMNWKAGKPLVFDNITWGQKDMSFPIIKDLPSKASGEQFVVAMNQTGLAPSVETERDLINTKWNVIGSKEASSTHTSYQDFIYRSKGEISIAKETYVKAKTGWFSCRSACYLASGRPVITQDTGWSEYYPTGSGLFPFSNEQEALNAIDCVRSNWKENSSNARAIAEEYFSHERVLTALLSSIN